MGFVTCACEHVRASMSECTCVRARACPISEPNEDPALTISYTTTGTPHPHPHTITMLHSHALPTQNHNQKHSIVCIHPI